MPTSSGLLSFETPRLAEEVEKLSPEEIDALPFGAIRLDREGRIVLYSARERLLSGYRQETLNQSFFADIAPCFDTPHYRGRMEAALKDGGLNIEFSEYFDMPNGEEGVELQVRMQSASDGGSWIFMRRLG